MRGKRLLALLMAVVMLAGVSTMPMVYAEEVSENEWKGQKPKSLLRCPEFLSFTFILL